MIMLRSKHITERLKDIENYLLEQYKNSRKDKKRDWRTYEERLAYRIKEAIKNLDPYIDEATKTIKIVVIPNIVLESSYSKSR